MSYRNARQDRQSSLKATNASQTFLLPVLLNESCKPLPSDSMQGRRGALSFQIENVFGQIGLLLTAQNHIIVIMLVLHPSLGKMV
jgi:hypothetical protein